MCRDGAPDLWDGNPTADANAILHSHLSDLRRVVGVERLRTRAGGYELVVARDELDATVFEAETAAGRTALARAALVRLAKPVASGSDRTDSAL